MRTLSELETLLNSGESLEVGKVIYEATTKEDQPRWAGSILELCKRHHPPIEEVEAVYQLAEDETQWEKAHKAFQAVRQRTLSEDPSSETLRLLLVAENVAKVIYNASEGAGPFDSDCGWWVVRCAKEYADGLNIPAFQEELWPTLSWPLRKQ